jgi:hypothetical protein
MGNLTPICLSVGNGTFLHVHYSLTQDNTAFIKNVGKLCLSLAPKTVLQKDAKIANKCLPRSCLGYTIDLGGLFALCLTSTKLYGRKLLYNESFAVTSCMITSSMMTSSRDLVAMVYICTNFQFQILPSHFLCDLGSNL